MGRKISLVLGFVILIAFGPSAKADSWIADQLGSGGPAFWGLLAGPTATDIHINGPGTSAGNAGIAAGQLSLDNPAFINGNVYLGTGVTINSGAAQVNGAVLTGQSATINAAVAADEAAASLFAGLATTESITSITGSGSIGPDPNSNGVTVIDLTGGINLGGKSVFTLDGSASSEYVINVGNQFVLNGSQIELSGGLLASNVIFNVLSGVNSIQTSGGLNQESVINGVLLANGAKLQLSPGAVDGEIFTNAQGDQIVSGGTFVQVKPPVAAPEPSTISLLVVGLAGIIETVRRKL